MKNIKYYLILFLLLPGLTYADIFDHAKAGERIATVGFFIVFAVGLLIAYLVYKKKESNKKNGERYRVKTFEVVQNGRKIVMTKKYKVIDETQYPNKLKRR